MAPMLPGKVVLIVEGVVRKVQCRARGSYITGHTSNTWLVSQDRADWQAVYHFGVTGASKTPEGSAGAPL